MTQLSESVKETQKQVTSAAVARLNASQHTGKFVASTGPHKIFAPRIANHSDGTFEVHAAATDTNATVISEQCKSHVMSGDFALRKTKCDVSQCNQSILEADDIGQLSRSSHSTLTKEYTAVGLESMNMASKVVNMASAEETAITAQSKGITIAAKQGDVSVTTSDGNLAIIAQQKLIPEMGAQTPAADPLGGAVQAVVDEAQKALLSGNVVISATSQSPLGGVAAIKSNTAAIGGRFATSVTGGIELLNQTYATAIRMFNAFTFVGQPTGSVDVLNAVEVPGLNLPSFADLAKGLEDCIPTKLQQANNDAQKALPNTINQEADRIAGTNPDAAEGAPADAKIENPGGIIQPINKDPQNSEERPVTAEQSEVGLPHTLQSGPKGTPEGLGKNALAAIGSGVLGVRGVLNIWFPEQDMPLEAAEESSLPDEGLQNLTRTIIDYTQSQLGLGGGERVSEIDPGLAIALLGAPNIVDILSGRGGLETIRELPQNTGLDPADFDRFEALLRDEAVRIELARIIAALNAQVALGFFGSISGALSSVSQGLNMAMTVVQSFSSISGLGGLGGLGNLLGMGQSMLGGMGGLGGLEGLLNGNLSGAGFEQILGMFGGGGGQLGQLIGMGQGVLGALNGGRNPMELISGLMQNQLRGILPAGVPVDAVMGMLGGLQSGRPIDPTQLLNQLGGLLPGGLGQAMGVFQQMQPILGAISSGDFSQLLGAGGLLSGDMLGQLGGLLGGLSPELGGLVEKLMPLMGMGQLLTELPKIFDIMNGAGLPILEQVAALLSCAALLNALRGALESLLEEEASNTPETQRIFGEYPSTDARVARLIESLPRIVQVINELQEVDRVLSFNESIRLSATKSFALAGETVSVSVDTRLNGFPLQTPFFFQIGDEPVQTLRTNEAGRFTIGVRSTVPRDLIVRVSTIYKNSTDELRIRFHWQAPVEFERPIPDQPGDPDAPLVPENPGVDETPITDEDPDPIDILPPPEVPDGNGNWPAPNQPSIRAIDLRSNRSFATVDERAILTVSTRINGVDSPMPFNLFIDGEEFAQSTDVDGRFQFELRSTWARVRRVRAELPTGQFRELEVTFVATRDELPISPPPETSPVQVLLRWVRGLSLPLGPDNCLRIPRLKASEATVEVLGLSQQMLTFSLKTSLPITLMPQIGGIVSLRAFDFYTDRGLLRTYSGDSLFSPSVLNFVIIDFNPSTRLGLAMFLPQSSFYLQDVDGVIFQYDPGSLGFTVNPEIEDAYLTA